MSADARSDEALLTAMRGGELTAFDALYARYERPLFGFIRQLLQDDAAAEDVLHETFLAVLRAKSAPQQVRAWLYQVARHHCLNRSRSTRREASATSNAPPPLEPLIPEGAYAQAQQSAAVARAVASLPAAQGELYGLRARGLSNDEVATVLGIPVGTVKSRMHELVKTLQEALKR